MMMSRSYLLLLLRTRTRRLLEMGGGTGFVGSLCTERRQDRSRGERNVNGVFDEGRLRGNGNQRGREKTRNDEMTTTTATTTVTGEGCNALYRIE